MPDPNALHGHSEQTATEEAASVTLTISLDAARWLYREMGRRPSNEVESGEIWAALGEHYKAVFDA